MELVGAEVHHHLSTPTRAAARGAGRRTSPLALSAAAFVVLAAASWAYILSDDDSGFGDLVSVDGWRAAAGFVGDLAGRGSESTPAFLTWSKWTEAATLAYRTLAMSVLAIAFAGVGVMLTFLPAARRLGSDDASAYPASAPACSLLRRSRRLHRHPRHTGAADGDDRGLLLLARHSARRDSAWACTTTAS